MHSLRNITYDLTDTDMNIQNHIVKIIIVIQEAGIGLTRNQLQDILTGQESEDVQNNEFDQLDSFGIAEGSEDEDWNAVFDRAIEEGLLKVKNQKRQDFLDYY